jgi:hypothetical protein
VSVGTVGEIVRPSALAVSLDRHFAGFARLFRNSGGPSGVGPVMIAAVWARILVLATGWVATAIVALIAGVLLSIPKLPVLLAGGGIWTCLLLLLSVPTTPVRPSGSP